MLVQYTLVTDKIKMSYQQLFPMYVTLNLLLDSTRASADKQQIPREEFVASNSNKSKTYNLHDNLKHVLFMLHALLQFIHFQNLDSSISSTEIEELNGIERHTRLFISIVLLCSSTTT